MAKVDGKLLKSANGFFSVVNPYISDDWVQQTYQMVSEQDFDQGAINEPIKHMNVLSRTLDHLRNLNGMCEVSIFDVGVYMGTFSIFASRICDDLQLTPQITCVEAMEVLKDSINANFLNYKLDSVTLILAALSDADGENLTIGTRKGGLIGSTVVRPEIKAGNDGTLVEVESLSLHTLLDRARTTHSLVKIDIEGNEVRAFNSISDNEAFLANNIFIIEFAPWQTDQSFGDGDTYGGFLLDNFDIYNIRSWGAAQINSQITAKQDLKNCLSNSNRQWNTDLLLIPKKMRNLGEALMLGR